MKTLIATALLIAAGTAGAHEVHLDAVAGISVSEVKTLYSTPTESRSEFAKRISTEFSAYTAETGHEACGMIAVRKDGADGVNPTFSVKMMTIGSQIACAGDKVEDGYNSMNTTIHSHPQSRNVRLSAVDRKVANLEASVRTIPTAPCQFSAQDYSTPGYLVTCGKVMFQNGRGTEKEL